MDVFTKHAASLASVEKYLGPNRPSIDFPAVAGKNYPCLAGSYAGGKELKIAGYAPNDIVKVWIRPSVFGNVPLPTEKTQVVFHENAADKTGMLRRINSITRCPGKSLLLMILTNPNK